MMPESFAQAPELLEALVACFLSSSDAVHCSPLCSRIKVSRNSTHVSVMPIAFIRDYLFPPKEFVFQFRPKNFLVRECSTRKRPVDPNDRAISNTNTHLVAHTRPIKLLGPPSSVKRSRFVYLEVCAVNRHIVSMMAASTTAPEAILPADLVRKKEISQ